MNCKYTIEWQCNRIELKNIKNLDQKLEYAEKVFEKFLNKKSDSIYSVLNWIKGLSLGYKDKTAINSLYEKLSSKITNDINFVAEELSTIGEIKNIKNKELLKQVLDDNLNKDIKWLGKYYIHKDLNIFIDNLAEVIGKNKKWYKKEELLKNCEGHKSEWKFLY